MIFKSKEESPASWNETNDNTQTLTSLQLKATLEIIFSIDIGIYSSPHSFESVHLPISRFTIIHNPSATARTFPSLSSKLPLTINRFPSFFTTFPRTRTTLGVNSGFLKSTFKDAVYAPWAFDSSALASTRYGFEVQCSGSFTSL